MEKIYRVLLLAKKEEKYSLFVFKDLETQEFIMCTRLPNWNLPYIEIGEIGFLKISKAVAGENYYDPNDQSFKPYRYTNNYMTNYIKETDITNSNIIL